jgi:hypothetical protein
MYKEGLVMIGSVPILTGPVFISLQTFFFPILLNQIA